ncbi:DNA-3-methyladenine glycosylase 2 family protein [Opitutus terrae]|uniref:DNA-3-methyladenine glycosylase 2 family protein n=1 Tax=Opitutus terrae TaxID=107709 RepID=UPI001ED93A61|nr:Ada metal-binding domain-containing protein [Opitutus terrae]
MVSPTHRLRLSPAQMYARVLAGDPAWNGHFFTGVLTTGIYCLPSCKARKPKRENVRFFPTCEAARAAGLRPCKKCHPDDFARGADPVLESVEQLVAEMRANPAAFSEARALVRRLGFGVTRTFELLRLHYHTTPAELLTRARIAAAQQQLLAGATPLADIAYSVGFDALSVFHENFRRLTGLTPARYRELPHARSFELTLPDGYLLGYLRRALSRDAQSVSERLEGDVYTAAVNLSGGPALLTLRLNPSPVRVEVIPAAGGTGVPPVGSRPPTKGERVPDVASGVPTNTLEAHAIAIGLLGLEDDASSFARLARKLGLARLVAGRSELRISRIPSVFDGLVWAIIGQQINFSFACVLKRRLTELAGTRLSNGLMAPPTPTAIARLEPDELVPLQFSRQKAGYLITTARAITAGELDLAQLPSMSASRAERTLLALHGFGPWSVNYVMMRALGFADCVPLGDTGVTSGLQSLLHLEQRPDVDATRRLMAVFSPHRSLATAHLWQLNLPRPT